MPMGGDNPQCPLQTSSRIPEKVPQVGWKVMGKSVHSGQDVFFRGAAAGPHSPHRWGELCFRKLYGQETKTNPADVLSVYACICNIILHFYLHKYLKVCTQKMYVFCLYKYLQSAALEGLPRWLSTKESACQSRGQGFDPWVGKIPWRRKWQPTPVFLPGHLMDRGAWWATVHGVTKSRTQVRD